MDAGTAAVLGALAGSAATIGAALATGWAQREGMRITARSEHRRERREPRQAVYRDFISAGSVMCAKTYLYVGDYEMVPTDVSESDYRELYDLAATVKEKSTEVALVGPRKVAEAGLKIGRLSIDLAAELGVISYLATGNEERDNRRQRRMQKRIAAHSKKLQAALDNFVLQAQAALDDDGSRK